MSKINESLANFAFDLLNKIGKADQDAFFSPTSINLALAMCYAGADGSTKSQMKQRFYGNDAVDSEIHSSMQALVNWFEESSTDKIQLTAANRLYCQKDFEILQQYRDIVEKQYKSGVLSVDFQNPANREKARTEINDWVSETTHQKIKNLISSSDINEDTKLILVNALYFKGNWESQFKKEITKRKEFFANPSKTVQVDMMNQLHDFFYYENSQCQAICMPYTDWKVKMAILLPKEKYGLDNLVKSISGAEFVSFVKSMSVCKVNVEMPKMKLEQSFKLGETLKHLGVDDAFNAKKSDFSLITGKRDLVISEVLHKAFIEVDEDGTEAAAATAVLMTKCFSLVVGPPAPPPKQFIADHPFLFAIMSSENNDILFVGHYYAAKVE